MSLRTYAFLARLALVLMVAGFVLWLLIIEGFSTPGDERAAFAVAFGAGLLLTVAVTLARA